jgi:CheY-like chemotaxis protein
MKEVGFAEPISRAIAAQPHNCVGLKRILIVEDDANLRLVVRMILEREGYEVAEAGHGIAALEAIGNVAPDLIIADLTMPLMNGAELINRIRANPTTISIPIVLLSGRQVDSAVSQAVSGVVTKPFEPADLLATIDRALHEDSKPLS